MALPQRRDPEEQQRRQLELERLEREPEIDRAGAGSWWLAWWWIWVLILLAIVWFGGWGWGGYGGWWLGRPRAVAVQTANGPQGQGIAVLNATDKQAFVGQRFQIRNVPIQKKVSDHVLWIGINNAAPMLVVLTGTGNNAANASLEQGDLVNITGTVEKAPDSAQAKQQWSLNDDGAKRLQQHGAYIQAAQVEKVQH